MDLNKQKKIKMFKSMFRIREFEDVVKQIYRDGKLKGHLQTCQGEEAMEVGAIEALSKGDIIFSNHRGHGHNLFKSSGAWTLFSSRDFS